VGALFVYDWQDQLAGSGDYFGLLTSTGAQKPSYTAFQTAADGVPPTSTPGTSTPAPSAPQESVGQTPAQQSAQPEGTATTLTVHPAVTNYGQTETMTATEAPVPEGGAVQFVVDGQPEGQAVPVSTASGTASMMESDLAPGQHNVVAQFLGSGMFGASSSPIVELIVDPSPTKLSVAPPISSGGSGFVLSATLSSGGALLLGQPIEFSVGSAQTCRALTDASGTATCLASGILTDATVEVEGYGATFAGTADYLGSSARSPGSM